MTDLQKWLRDTEPKETYGIRPRLICPDGWSVSIQAGYGKYSAPREYGHGGWYGEVELGFPSAPMLTDLWNGEHQEQKDTIKTVWGYVPIDKVQKELKAHGWKYEEVAK